jgi:hypothetical protein
MTLNKAELTLTLFNVLIKLHRWEKIVSVEKAPDNVQVPDGFGIVVVLSRGNSSPLKGLMQIVKSSDDPSPAELRWLANSFFETVESMLDKYESIVQSINDSAKNN